MSTGRVLAHHCRDEAIVSTHCTYPRKDGQAELADASEIRTKATPCVEVWQTSNLRPLRLGEEKKKEEKERTNHSMKI